MRGQGLGPKAQDPREGGRSEGDGCAVCAGAWHGAHGERSRIALEPERESQNE